MTTPWILAFAALWVTVVLVGLIVLGTVRRILPVIERAEEAVAAATSSAGLDGLQPGEGVPPFTALSTGGATFTELDLRNTRTAVLFVGESCPACERLIDDLESREAADLGIHLVAVSEAEATARRISGSSDLTVLDQDGSVARAFRSNIVPHAFVVEHGTVAASGVPNDWQALRDLVVQAEEGGGREFEVPAASVVTNN